MIELVFVVLFTFILGGYLWLRERHRFWENHRVPHLKSESLFFGNIREAATGRISMNELVEKHYQNLAPHKFGGVYLNSKPVLYVRDPELIKRILIKDFHCFADRSFIMSNQRIPLSRHLFFLVGEEWSVLRQKLTPTFTSGKMKMLFVLMKECAEKMEMIVEKSALDQEVVNAKELMARYTTDVISSCAFGLESDSLNNADSEFRVKGKASLAPSLRRRLFDFLANTCPSLLWILGSTPLSRDVINFFTNVVDETIDYRKQNGVVRNDFLDLLLNLQKDERGEEKNYDFSIAAQCFLFFLAGFETSSSALSFILYELAAHSHVQEKLQEEVDRVLTSHDGKITYESLQEMRYMDKVFSETARLFPLLPNLQRTCTQDYRFPDSDFIMKRGAVVFIPVQGLHRDPKYFPNPHIFNPENFSEEAKAARPACTFLPFGDGPRNCIGMRFGMMQVKLGLTMIMRQYTVTVSPQMKLPLELMPFTVVTTSKNEILLNFQKRGE